MKKSMVLYDFDSTIPNLCKECGAIISCYILNYAMEITLVHFLQTC